MPHLAPIIGTMVFLKIFLFLFAPFLVWWLTARWLQARGKRKNDSHAIGIGVGLFALFLALIFIAQTTERLPQ